MTNPAEKLLLEIAHFLDKHGYPPSVRDLMWALNWSSTSVVVWHRSTLIRDGYLEMDKKVARSLRLTAKGRLRVVGLSVRRAFERGG